MKRRSFMQLSVGLVGSSFLPVSIKTYAEPVWKHAALVDKMSGPSTLVQFNMRTAIIKGHLQYVRSFVMMQAAGNVTEQDIVNEFYSKYYDDDAMITTAGAEDHFHLDERPESSFRKHLTVGQVKEHIKNVSERQKRNHMEDYKHTDANNAPRKWKKYLDGNVMRTHTVFDDGRESHHEVPIYTIETFAKEMVDIRDQELKRELENDQFSKSNLRAMLRKSLELDV